MQRLLRYLAQYEWKGDVRKPFKIYPPIRIYEGDVSIRDDEKIKDQPLAQRSEGIRRDTTNHKPFIWVSSAG